MKTLILFSEPTASNRKEDLDTMLQVEEISESLIALGHQTSSLVFSKYLGTTEQALINAQPDCVFNLVESVQGKDACLHAATSLLEFLNLPFTGCPSYALALLSSKTRHKQCLHDFDLPTPDFLNYGSTHHLLSKLAINDEDRYIIKSDTEHGSLGMDAQSIGQGKEYLEKTMRAKQSQWGGQWFAEKYIAGREFNIAMLEQADAHRCEVLPIAEMQFLDFPDDKPHIVDYQAKWDSDSWVSQATQRKFMYGEKDQTLIHDLKHIAQQCWDKFALRGAARVDIRVDEQGKPWILEINANPCLSKDAGFMAAALQADMSHQAVIARLIDKRVQ